MPQISRPEFPVSVVVIVLFQVAALFARSLLELSLIDHGYATAVAKDLSYLVVPPILLVLIYPYIKRCKDALLDLLRPADLTVRLVVLSILLGLVLRLTYWAVLTVLIWMGALGSHDPNATFGPIIGFDCPSLPILLLSFAVMSFLVPITEEVGNRGFILHALLPRGVMLSVIVSSLLFAVMHQPHSYAWAFCGGLFFAVQALNYRTLWAPMIAHATFNGAMIIDWECLRIVWNPLPGDPDLRLLGGISVPVALAGIAAALFLASKTAAGARKAPRRL